MRTTPPSPIQKLKPQTTTPTSKKKLLVLLVLILIAGALIWWWSQRTNPATDTNTTSEQQIKLPSINGNIVDESKAKLRPMAVVIENHTDSRPQSGLTDAEIVYETLAEGGITRFLAVFQTREPKAIGPVRSARPYFNFLADMWHAPLVHSGGSKQALSELSAGVYKNLFDINEFYFGSTFRRDSSRQAPHNLYTAPQNLRDLLDDKKQTNWTTRKLWDTKTTPTSELSQATTNITIPFSVPSYLVKFQYDPTTSSYARFVAGIKHIDANNDLQISPKNVIVQLTDITPDASDELGTQKIRLTGNGPCYLFSAGTFKECRWSYTEGKHTYTDTEGNPLILEQGQTWIAVFPRDKQNLISWN